MRAKHLVAGVAGLALCAGFTVGAEAREIPALADLEGSGEDGYWEYYEVTDEDNLATFQAIVGEPGDTMANPRRNRSRSLSSIQVRMCRTSGCATIRP